MTWIGIICIFWFVCFIYFFVVLLLLFCASIFIALISYWEYNETLFYISGGFIALPIVVYWFAGFFEFCLVCRYDNYRDSSDFDEESQMIEMIHAQKQNAIERIENERNNMNNNTDSNVINVKNGGAVASYHAPNVVMENKENEYLEQQQQGQELVSKNSSLRGKILQMDTMEPKVNDSELREIAAIYSKEPGFDAQRELVAKQRKERQNQLNASKQLHEKNEEWFDVQKIEMQKRSNLAKVNPLDRIAAKQAGSNQNILNNNYNNNPNNNIRDDPRFHASLPESGQNSQRSESNNVFLKSNSIREQSIRNKVGLDDFADRQLSIMSLSKNTFHNIRPKRVSCVFVFLLPFYLLICLLACLECILICFVCFVSGQTQRLSIQLSSLLLSILCENMPYLSAIFNDNIVVSFVSCVSNRFNDKRVFSDTIFDVDATVSD